MANELQSLLDYYANNPNQGKRADVALATAQKKQEMSPATPADYRNATLIGQTGYGAKSASQIESDLVNLSPIQRALKYGLDANAQMAQGMTSAGNDIYRQSTGERSTLATVGDTVNDIATAVVNFGGNTAALALSPFSPEYASGMTSLLTDFNKYSQSLQSQSLNDRRAVMNDTLHLAQRDTTKAFNESDQGTVASLQRIGQDVLDSVAVGASDSQTLLSGVAQGVGSMVGIGPLGKGISALTGLSKTAGTMGAIGIQGAGGARTQAAQEAQAALADRTDLTQEQKYALENQAGLKAAAIAGPASVLMGRLVAKFEGNPLARVNLRTAAGNVRNETIEEGLQSASEQLGVNQGIQSTIDPNRSMSQGVGETVGLGALYGAGTAGAMSAPALTRGAVADTGAAIGKASKAAGSFLQKRADAVVARNEAASPVSQTRVNDAIDASVAALTPEVMAAVPEADNEYVRSLVQAVAFDPAELVQAGAPQILIEAVGDANTRVKAIQRMAALVSALDPETDADFLAAAYALNDQITRFNQVVDSDPAAWEAMPEDHPTVLAVRAVDDAVARAMQSPALIHANNKIMESMDKVPTPKTSDLTEAALYTAAGQKAVQDNVIMAELAPDRANLEMTQKILKHAQAGLLSLTPQQMRALKVAEGLLQAVQDAHASGNYMGLEGIPFVVSQDILTNDKSRKKDHDSALAYTNQVLGAMRIGRPEQAKMALENFMEFVTHMNNKVQAIGDHYKTGVHTRETGLHYQARLAPGKFGQSADKVWVNPNAPKSMRQVRAIEREADTLRKIANAMATAYPELGVSLAPRVLLPDAISSVKNKQAETAPAAPSQPNTRAESQVTQTVTEQPASTGNPVIGAAMKALALIQSLNPQLRNKLRVEVLDEQDMMNRPTNSLTGKGARAGSVGAVINLVKDGATWEELKEEVRHLIDKLLGGSQIAKWIDEDPDMQRRVRDFLNARPDRAPNTRYDDGAEIAQSLLDQYFRNPDAVEAALPDMFTYLEQMGAAKYRAVMDSIEAAEAASSTGQNQQTAPAPAAKSVLEVKRAKITPDPVQGKSKYTPAQAAKMDPEKLNEELGALTEKAGKRTPDEEATFAVLDAQMTIWENEAADQLAREEAEAEAEDAAKAKAEANPVSRITAEQASRLSDTGLTERLNALKDKRTLKENTPEDDATFEVLNAEMSNREDTAYQDLLAKEWEQAKKDAQNQEDDVRTIPDEVVEQAVDQARDKELTTGEQDRLEKLQGTKEAKPKAEVVPTPEVVLEPAPEPVVEPDEDAAEQAEMAQAKKSLTKIFSGLINRPHMPNRFWSSYRVNTKNMSRLLGVSNAVEFVRDALSSNKRFAEITGTQPTVHLDEELRNSYDDLLSFAASWKQNMNQNLQDLVAGKKEKTDKNRIKNLLNGKANDKGVVHDILGFDNYRALSLTEQVMVDGKPTLQYNENLVDAVTMAGVQWLLQGEKAAPESFDEREAGKLLGIDENQVTSTTFQLLAGSLTNLQLVNDLAKRIKEYWGVQGKNDVQLGDSDGIAMNAALELISAMMKDGVLTRTTYTFNSTGQLYSINDKHTGLELKETPKMVDGEPVLKDGEPVMVKEKPVSVVTYKVAELDYKQPYFKFANALDNIILTQREAPFYLDRERPPVPKTQMRNPYVQNTPEQIKALENEAATRFRLNTVMFNLYHALQEVGITKLFGPGEFNENNTNVNDRLTKDGQMKSRLDAFKRLNELYAQLEARAEFLGLTPEEIDIRYGYNMSSVGRMQQLGPFGPQASKLMREAILPTESVLDLTDKTSENYQMWMLGLAQALGVKVHTQPIANSIADLFSTDPNAKFSLETKFKGVVSDLQNWLDNGQGPLSEDFIAKTREVFGEPVPEVAMHALVDYARYLNASQDERKSFKTFVYVEADGVANGPTNAMMMMTVGQFNENWVNNMKKGGFWIGKPNVSMNTYRQEDKVDLYEEGAKNMAEANVAITENIGYFARHPDTRKRTRLPQKNLFHLSFLLDKFLPGATLSKDGKLVINRGAMKNPMTITIYGSGEKGIAGKVFMLMAEAIYGKLSEAMQKMEKYEGDITFAQAMFGGSPEAAIETAKQFFAAINALTAESTYYNSMYDFWGRSKNPAFRKVNPATFDPIKFTFTSDQVQTMTKNILNLFVKPMRTGISSTIGEGLQTGSELVRDATQVHSILLADAFQRALQEKLAAKKAANPGYKRNDFLTPNEIKELFGPLSQLSPLVRTAVQTYFVAGSQSVLDMNTRITTDFDGQAQVQAFLPGPANSGVSGIPYLTIGTGDGMMMQILATMKEGVSKNMKVFDGMNIALDQVVKGSQQANQAVWESWQGNPLAAVNETYQALLADADLTNLSSQSISDLRRALKIDEDYFSDDPIGFIQEEMASLGQALKAGAMSVEARHRALARFNVSVDQMASAAAPYRTTGGIDASTWSDAEILSELQKAYEEELSKLTENEEASKTSEDISKDLEDVGTELKSGVRSLPLTVLHKLAKVIKIPESQMDALTQVLRVLAPRGYKVIAGTPAQLLKYIADRKMAKLSETDAQALLEGKIGGWTHMRSKTVFVANGSSETLVHELVHGATIDTIYAHYSGQDLGEKGVAVRHAISNLEKLMAQFMQMGPNLSATDAETRTAYANAVAAIEEYNQDTSLDSATARTKALNEFMAWGLTNQKLVRAMKRTEASPLVRLAQRVVQSIKQLIWGSVEIPAVGNDMFSNLMFNSAIVMELSPSVKAAGVSGIAKHSAQQNSRIQALDKAMVSLMSAMPITGMTGPANYNAIREAKLISGLVVNNAKAHGFAMTPAEQSSFSSLVAAMTMETKLNKGALLEAHRLYDHVSKNLKVEDFMVDPESTNPNDFALANNQFNFVMGTYGTETDKAGRSTLLSTFIALSAVNEDMRRALDRIAMPEKLVPKWTTLNDSLESIGLMGMESLRQRIMALPEGQTLAGMDALIDQLIQSSQQRENAIEQQINQTGNLIDSANDYVVEAMKSLSEKAVNFTKNRSATKPNRFNDLVSKSVELTAALVNEDRAELVSEGIMSALNRTKLNETFRTFIGDLVGRTKSNATILDMVKWVRNRVQATRQQYRENLPTVIMSKFSRPMTDNDMTAMFIGLIKTDLLAMRTTNSLQEVFDLIHSDKKVNQEIAALEKNIAASDKKHWPLIQAKSKQLANFMNTGVAGPVLLRNAYAISRLFGLVDQNAYSAPLPATVAEIDKLVSLYALQSLDANTKKTLKNIATTEKDGMHFLMSYLVGQRKEEQRKSSFSMAQANHYKGYVPSVQTQNGSVIVADDSQYGDLVARGYTRIGDYQGSSIDTRAKRGYYYVDVNPRSPFSQGLTQHVRMTSGGVDVTTGYTMGSSVAGVIRDPYTVRKTAARMGSERGVEHVLPVFDDSGKVVAFELSMDPSKLSALAHDTHAARMIGVWRGRQVEEVEGLATNEVLIDRLFDMYQEDSKQGRSDEYVNVFDEADDKVIIDAVALINPQVRDMIKAKFGDEFMVRRDMLNDVLGYREASIGDAWSGISRWSPDTMKQVRTIGMAVFGNDAYRYMVNAETTLQNYIKDARVLIVVKSVIVPAANLASNILQLVTRGVPLVQIARDIPKKVIEVNEYTKSRLRKIEAEAELMAAKDDVVKARKLTAEIKSIEDSHRRMSIWPLIEAGEFSAISDAGISREDILLVEGRLNQYIESLTDKLPQEVKTLGKYAVVAKDTALFQGLQKAVEYGDFLGKAMTYDHLTQKKKLSKTEALSKVSEEFVNYDRLPGRTRGALENNGLLWFYNFKIRSVKVAASMIRNNPVHAFLSLSMANASGLTDMGLGTPIQDNLLAVIGDDRLGYSMGPGQGLHALSLNPWVNLMN